MSFTSPARDSALDRSTAPIANPFVWVHALAGLSEELAAQFETWACASAAHEHDCRRSSGDSTQHRQRLPDPAPSFAAGKSSTNCYSFRQGKLHCRCFARSGSAVPNGR